MKRFRDWSFSTRINAVLLLFLLTAGGGLGALGAAIFTNFQRGPGDGSPRRSPAGRPFSAKNGIFVTIRA